MAKSYKLANNNNITGYKGARLTNDNLASFPDRLLEIWHKAGIIKEIKTKKIKDE